MELLRILAERYERREFVNGDPSWFMHQIDGARNRELMAFIASALSYGSRKQFLPKIQGILDDIKSVCGGYGDDAVARWLTEHCYHRVFDDSNDCFYRLYTCGTFRRFLDALALMVDEYGSIKAYLKMRMQSREALEAIELITRWFNDCGSKGVIPKPIDYRVGGKCSSSASSCKRVCMFLRWMVRTDSPVDLGLWADIIDRRTLIIPMDTHVIQEAQRFGLLTSGSTSMANAIKLTNSLAKVFPDDPLKADFALFGLGVDDSVHTSI